MKVLCVVALNPMTCRVSIQYVTRTTITDLPRGGAAAGAHGDGVQYRSDSIAALKPFHTSNLIYHVTEQPLSFVGPGDDRHQHSPLLPRDVDSSQFIPTNNTSVIPYDRFDEDVCAFL